MEQEQTIPNVEIIPIEKESQPVTVTEIQAQSDVHDSSSNISLSQEEILSLKRKNLTEALKGFKNFTSFQLVLDPLNPLMLRWLTLVTTR